MQYVCGETMYIHAHTVILQIAGKQDRDEKQEKYGDDQPVCGEAVQEQPVCGEAMQEQLFSQ